MELNQYVESLDKIPDDEVVLFNFAVQDKEKFAEILKQKQISLGESATEWRCDKQGGGQSDSHLYDVWSPLMTAKEAKEIMPSMVEEMDKQKISSNLIVPMKAKDIFTEKKEYNQPDQAWINDELIKLMTKGDYDQCTQADWKSYSQDDKEFVNELFGHSPTSTEMPQEFASGATTLAGIKKEFPEDQFLFSGTMVSDDYFAMSPRAGRNGTLYATPFIDYAKKYDGIYDLTGANENGGASVTGDVYKSSVIGHCDNDAVHIGFINVYRQSEDDKFFKNFGMDDARRSSNVQLSKQEALNGYLSNFIDAQGNPIPVKDAETYVTEDKNPLVAKYMHIRCAKSEYFVKVPENPDELTKFLLASRQADMSDTFAKRKPHIKNRLAEQKNIYQQMQQENAMEPKAKEGNTAENSAKDKAKFLYNLRMGINTKSVAGAKEEAAVRQPATQNLQQNLQAEIIRQTMGKSL